MSNVSCADWLVFIINKSTDKLKFECLDVHALLYANELYTNVRSDLPFKNFIYSQHLTRFGSFIVKNKLTSVFCTSVLFLKINFIITMSKFTVEPLTCGLWFHGHFDNVMMQFIINKRTDTYVNVRSAKWQKLINNNFLVLRPMVKAMKCTCRIAS